MLDTYPFQALKHLAASEYKSIIELFSFIKVSY